MLTYPWVHQCDRACANKDWKISWIHQQSRADLAGIDRAAALRGFFAIVQAWGITAEDARALLGAPAEQTFDAWRAGNVVGVPMDTLRRVGHIAGIFKALEVIYSDPKLADGWIKRPNRALGDQTPLQRMRAGDVTDLAAVRGYLEAAQAPWS